MDGYSFVLRWFVKQDYLHYTSMNESVRASIKTKTKKNTLTFKILSALMLWNGFSDVGSFNYLLFGISSVLCDVSQD